MKIPLEDKKACYLLISFTQGIISFADGYTTDDISYIWKSVDPVQIAQNLSLPRFSIENYDSSYCTVKTNTGK